MLLPFAQPLQSSTATARSQAYGAAHSGVSPADTQSFHEQGFLVIPELCNAAELQSIRVTLKHLFARHAGRDEGNQFDMLSLDHNERDSIQPQIVNPSWYAPSLLRTQYFRRVQAMAHQLLGHDAQFSFDHSILKPAGKIAATPWHQDEAHVRDEQGRCEQISFWMPLQDVSEANGCMRYVPGSNLGAVLPHQSPGDDPRVHALECPTRYFDESSALAQPVAAGTCILHTGRTLHSALPNRTDADRLVYVIVFRTPPLAHTDSMPFTWLDTKRTAALERKLRWRYRGGVAVLVMRWVRRMLFADLRTLSFKLMKKVARTRTRSRTGWRAPH